MNNNIEIGDLVISNDTVYEIISIRDKANQKYYTIEALENPADMFLDEAELANIKKFAEFPIEKLKILGKIVKKEEASKAIEILFKK